MAIAAVANELSSTFKKVVLWGVGSYPDQSMYPCRPLREMKNVEALVVNGTNDDIVNSTKFSGKDKSAIFESKMPPRIEEANNRTSHYGTQYVSIEGGNHSGCAHYGPQVFPLPDGIRSITLEQQQRQMAEATADFLLYSSKKD